MKKHLTSRLLSLLLVVAMLCGFAVPVTAADSSQTASLSFEKADSGDLVGRRQGEAADESPESQNYADTDVVRVSIILEKKSTLEAGFSTAHIAENRAAMAYRAALADTQEAVKQSISRQALSGAQLDVVWNLTLAANIISAKVPYGKIEAIKAVDGVRDVMLETRYEPCVMDREEAADPNMATSGEMIGRNEAYAAGYTGAGARIAIIDTGIDTDHQSFSAAGFEYSLGQQASRANLSLEEYLAGLNLLSEAEIAEKLELLNIKGILDAKAYTASDLYVNSKLAFGFNYVDAGLDLTHDNDLASEHGSHVAGIAAANAYIPGEDGTFARALDTVLVQGVAPDAQILTMKVFGENGGAYDSDYMAAMEDAVILGADAINLSLGSSYPGFSRSATAEYQEIMENLSSSDTVVTISAGNAGTWADSAATGGYLYTGDVNLQTAGSPGSFTNALTVASADNAGATGNYFTVNDRMVFYRESRTDSAGRPYANESILTLAGEQEYVWIDGIGTEEEFAALGDALAGKIAFCSRGTTAFSAKAEAAVQCGAIATVIYNNQPGVIGMDLSDYRQTAPCVSVTQADGAWIRAASQAVTDENGNVLYYTGKLSISETLGCGIFELDYNTMSSFSSWGVPGNLELKPEITAPGGSIYSVNGLVAGGQAYETMSGTSMAAPQVTGMAALAAQYIQARKLDEKTGLSVRTLSQSLLMSTAEPLFEENGYYYPVLSQGAGLANIGAALSAKSFLLMNEDATASYADGKVKAELLDDPDRDGTYSFSFTLQGLTGETTHYTLSGDFFTQGVFTEDGVSYLDTATVALGAQVSYTVDGRTFVPTSELLCDLDGDGDTDADDAQLILNFAAGLLDAVDPAADLDGDGKATTYDAYLLLKSLKTEVFSLENGEAVTVTVHVTLPEPVKEALNATYENGTYLEGYVFVHPVTTGEGALEDVTHSIPVLGFYGNWSDASMFDRVSYAEYLYGNTTVPYTGVVRTNNLIVKRKADTTRYWMLGNPYIIEEAYPEGRAAVNSGDTLYEYRISMIRNAAALTAVITNQDGEILSMDSITRNVVGAYYNSSSAIWYNTFYSYNLYQKVAALGVSEGDELNVSIVAVPEYYADGASISKAGLTELLQSGKLGTGACLTTTLTVDDTAPEVLDITKSLVNGDLIVTARDNNYIAAVEVLNPAGNKLYGYALSNQTGAGQTAAITVDLSAAAIGPNCLVLVADYAGNESVYKVAYGGEPEDSSGKMYGFAAGNSHGSNGPRWFEIVPDQVYYSSSSNNGGMTVAAYTDLNITAAEYVDGYVFMAANDGYLYVAEQGSWDVHSKAGYYGDVTATIKDMAFNYADSKLYALGDDNVVYSVDLETCTLREEFSLTIENPKSSDANKQRLQTLAIDDSGTFYAINYGSALDSFLYRWTAADLKDGKITGLKPISETATGKPGFLGTMAWDHDREILYWACSLSSSMTQTNSGNNTLLVMDLETGKAVNANATDTSWNSSKVNVVLAGMYVVPSGNDFIGSSEKATGITMSTEQMRVLVGSEFQLSADVYPWNLKDASVIWSTSDETVAMVRDGFVTALHPGTATITATTVSAPHLTATCQVTVAALPDISLSGLVFDPNSDARWSEFTSNKPARWAAVSEKTGGYIAGTLLDGVLYTHDGSKLYGTDPDNFEVTEYGSIASDWIWSDAAPAPATEDGAFGKLVGLCNVGTYLEVLDPVVGTLNTFVMINEYSTDPLAAIAYVESGTYEYGGTQCPSCTYYVMTEGGQLWRFVLYAQNKSYGLVREHVGGTGLDLSNVSAVTGNSYASMLYDQDTGYLVLSAHQGGSTTQIYLVDPETCLSARAGEFGDDVWPVVSLYQYRRVTELTVRVKPAKTTVYAQDSVQLTSRVLPEGYDSAVTWSSSDPSVATVDENGLVTGHREGSAVITATSVAKNDAGERASASCVITVQPLTALNTTVHAQITTDSGASWVTIDTGDLSGFTTDAKAASALNGGGAHDGKLYGSDWSFDGNSSCNLLQIDPANGYAETAGSTQVNAASSIADATTSPAMVYKTTYMGETISVDVFGNPLFWATGQGLFFLTDFNEAAEGVGTGWTDMAGRGFTGCGAIAYVGYTTDYSGNPSQNFLVLDADGLLRTVRIMPNYMAWNNKLMYNLGTGVYGKLNMEFPDYTKLSMEYIDDGVNKGLLIAYSGNGLAELYYADMNAETLAVGKIGNVPGASGITALYTDASLNSADAAARTADEEVFAIRAGTADTASTLVSMAVNGSEAEALSAAWSGTAESRNRTSGSTHALRGQTQAAPATVHIAGAVAEATDGAVTLTVAEDVDVTNGLVKITYDSSILEYAGLSSGAANTAVRAENGVITFAYAAADPIPAGNALACVKFTCTAQYIETELRLETLQRNADTAVEEAPTCLSVVHEIGDHDYVLTGHREPTETEDGYDEYTCSRCGEKKVEILPAIACPSARFSDVERDRWYHAAIDFMVVNDYLRGTSETTMTPNGKLTRAMLVTLFYRVAGEEAVSGTTTFADVAAHRWYTDAVIWAQQNDIVKGTGATIFSPSSYATREMAITVLYRFAGAEADSRDNLSAYKDAANISGWAKEAMNWAVGAGHIQGYGNRTLNPQGVMTRAEFAQMLMNYLQK